MRAGWRDSRAQINKIPAAVDPAYGQIKDGWYKTYLVRAVRSHHPQHKVRQPSWCQNEIRTPPNPPMGAARL